MIGTLYRGAIRAGARALVPTGLHPNQVTMLALAVGLASCAIYLWTRNAALFAALMIAGGYLDTLDGEVARLTNQRTPFGGYLDAVSDRIFDSTVLFTIAFVADRWLLCMAMAVGGFMVSYAKARAAMEAPISNLGWPHLMGREERVIGLAATLLLWSLYPGVRVGPFDILACGLALMTLGLVITAVRRIRYAAALLDAAEAR
jgi:phosphatidylglycerophosphate synthase